MYALSRCDRRAGFTLIEMAVSLIVIGILLVPALVIYNNYAQSQRSNGTYANVQFAVDSLQSFRNVYGRYPCPAPLNLPRNNAAYGHEGDCLADGFAPDGVTAGDLEPASVNINNCSDGFCVEASVRTTPVLSNPRVIVGALPFRDLQIPEERTLDRYGGRIVYAITESMAVTATFNDNNGGIEVLNAQGSSLLQPNGSAAFLVLSHGRTQEGAYANGGQLIQACGTLTRDSQNCNDGFEDGTAGDSVYISDYENGQIGASFYDDVVLYFSQIYDPQWKRVESNPEDIQDLSPDGVGVGTNTPVAALDIVSSSSSTRSLAVYGTDSTDGTIYTDRICDESGADCFVPSVLGATPPATPDGVHGMICPTGYMIGISGGQAVCDELAVTCPASAPILAGVNADGTPDCREPPGASCPADTRTECGVTINLPSSADTVVVSNTVGACRTVEYRCDGGTWNWHDASGQCSFTPVTTTTEVNCGTGYGGATYTQTTTTQCLGGTTTTDNYSSACTCVGATVPEALACSDPVLAGLGFGNPGWSGTATRDIVYSPPGCTGTPGAWDTSGCACTGGSLPPETDSCSAILGSALWAGTATRTTTYDAGTCTSSVGAWDTSACTCSTTPLVEYENHVCSDTVCQEPDPDNMDEYTTQVEAATCSYGVRQQTVIGSCRPRTFQWNMVEATGLTASSIGPNANYIGDSCSCSDHQDTSGSGLETCFNQNDPSRAIYRCKCQ